MESESGVTRSIINELHSSDIQRDQIEGESGVTGNIIDHIHSCDMEGDQMEGEGMVLLKVSSMDLNLVLSK